MIITQTKEDRSVLAWVLLLLLSFIWGSSFILIKKALVAFPASQVGSLRIFEAFVVFSPIAFTHLRQPSGSQWKYILLSGLLGSLIPSFLFSNAGSHLNSSVSGTLNALTPLCTLVVGTFMFGQRIRLIQLLGLLLGIMGCALLILFNAKGEMTFGNPYVLLVVTATVCYGFNLNIIKKYLSNLKPLHLAALALLCVGPMAGIYLFSTDFVTRIAPETWLPLGCGLLLGILGTAIANVIFNKIIQLSTAVFASSVTYFLPVVAVMWGVLDGERLLLHHYAGMVTILLGVYLVNRKSSSSVRASDN